MSKIIARNASFYLEDSSAASRAMSGLVNTITLGQTAETPETTSFGQNTRERLPGGLLDYEVSVDAFFSTGANEVDAVLSGIVGSCTVFKFGPSGSSSGCIQYSGSVGIPDYSINLGVEGAATVSFTCNARSGSLTRGTW